MREINFSIPSSNRASVSITTALYDRRALDCTSTLPLINSLNHLCYLTTSSARIREILTIDGGIERLICILKSGRSDDMFDVWKWNLAFHCVVNIGVRGSDGKGSDSRGSENIRTRVVEADIVPVIATILDNYDQMVKKTRAQHLDTGDVKRSRARPGSCRRRHDEEGERTPRGSSRREAPPPIAILPASHATSLLQGQAPMAHRTTSPRAHGSHRHHRRHLSLPGHVQSVIDEEHVDGPMRAVPQPDSLAPGESILANILPPMTATSQPDTPVTPRRPSVEAHDAPEPDSASRRLSQRRPSIRREPSASENSDEEPATQLRDETMTEIANNVNPAVEGPSVLEELDGRSSLDVDSTDNADTVTLPMGHPPADGSIIDSRTTPTPPVRMQAPVVLNSPAATEAPGGVMRPLGRERMLGGGAFASAPRDEDVIMSLQLLAYISKYCDLRSYFQQTHYVPRLKIRKSELARMDPLSGRPTSCPSATENEAELDDEEDYDNDAEYCQPNDVNIFPLVENFTIKWHSQEMKYWAGVVMRNLCRKDKSRGDIRQCAYYKCGKWEEVAKQFAKCRRCRQTKYCSKECQKSAWTLHRWWCSEATTQR